MATITMSVCDECKRIEVPTSTWEIVTPKGAVRRLDLCEEHSAPLQALFDIGAPAGRRSPSSRRPPRGGAGGTMRVTTLEEIAAMKRKA